MASRATSRPPAGHGAYKGAVASKGGTARTEDDAENGTMAGSPNIDGAVVGASVRAGAEGTVTSYTHKPKTSRSGAGQMVGPRPSNTDKKKKKQPASSTIAGNEA